MAINGVDFTATQSPQSFLLYNEPLLTNLSVAGGPRVANTVVTVTGVRVRVLSWVRACVRVHTITGSGFLDYAPLKPLYACQFGASLVPATWHDTATMSCAAPVAASGSLALQVGD